MFIFLSLPNNPKTAVYIERSATGDVTAGNGQVQCWRMIFNSPLGIASLHPAILQRTGLQLQQVIGAADVAGHTKELHRAWPRILEFIHAIYGI